MDFLGSWVDGVNASVFKALPDVFLSECLGKCWDQHMKELGPSHANISHLEVISSFWYFFFSAAYGTSSRGWRMWVQWGWGETADLNVVFLHPSHVFDVEQMAFVAVQQHQKFLVCPPQIPLLQECHKLLAILCKHLCINVSRLCGLDGISRGGCFSPLVLHFCCLEKNHGGYHHAPSTDVSDHCTGVPFVI